MVLYLYMDADFSSANHVKIAVKKAGLSKCLVFYGF